MTMVSGGRVQAMERRAQRITGGFHKTVTLEQYTYAAGTSDYRPGSSTLVFSILVDPTPQCRVTSEEDIAEAGSNVSLGDYKFDLAGGGSITDDQMRSATRIVLNKDLSDQEILQIQQVRVSDQPEVGGGRKDQLLDIVQGYVLRWRIYARGTKTGV